METLKVKVERETKEKIERLVKVKGYKNKCEALRRMIDAHFEEHPELFAEDELRELAREASTISDKDFDAMAAEILRGRKTTAELVREDGGRT